MSILDLLTDADILNAGQGIASLCFALADNGIDPMPYLTEQQWLAMQALACPVVRPPKPVPGRLAGAPGDADAKAAAEGN